MERSSTKDHDVLIRLDQKVSDLILKVSKLTDDITQQLADHETRLRALEKVRWLVAGGAGILGAIITVLVQHFVK